MPRLSPEAASYSTSTTRLKPPAHLTDEARAEFVSLVLAMPADHFGAADQSMLAAYCRAVVGERVAHGELTARPIIDGKPSPQLAVWQAHVRACTTQARRLGLGPAGHDRSRAGKREVEPVSYYDRMAMESEHDDAN